MRGQTTPTQRFAEAVDDGIEPVIDLFIAIVRQAKTDLNLPVRADGFHSPSSVTAYDRKTAREFLNELQWRALRGA